VALVSQLLDGLLGAAQCFWCLVDGTRAHRKELKTMKGQLSSSLWSFSAKFCNWLKTGGWA
jgi:hypothetical protein